ncbi:MAG: DUF424 family protein [archaeon]|nr:DUF424 family protein [archaeon]
MFYKIHHAYRDVIAVCDETLIGKIFEEDKFQLEVKESFFKGETASEKELIEILVDFSKEDATFNIVGEDSIKTALKAGIVEKNGIKKINNIPFALVLV